MKKNWVDVVTVPLLMAYMTRFVSRGDVRGIRLITTVLSSDISSGQTSSDPQLSR